MSKKPNFRELHLDLSSEKGITEAGVMLAEIVCRSMLFEVVHHTRPDLRGDLFERFMSGIAGASLAALGPERTKQALEAAKVAVDDFARVKAAQAKH